MKHDQIERVLRHPVSWVTGGVVSVVTVAFSALGDPIGASAAIIAVFYNQATTLFTAASIGGFTVVPAVLPQYTEAVQLAAVVLGVLVIGKLMDSIWESIKNRLTD